MMRKILLSLGLLVIFVSSTFALLPEERVLMYRVFDKLDTQLSKKSISKQVESLSGMITTIHAWERVE